MEGHTITVPHEDSQPNKAAIHGDCSSLLGVSQSPCPPTHQLVSDPDHAVQVEHKNVDTLQHKLRNLEHGSRNAVMIGKYQRSHVMLRAFIYRVILGVGYCSWTPVIPGKAVAADLSTTASSPFCLELFHSFFIHWA